MGFKLSCLFNNDNVANPKGIKKHTLPYLFIWVLFYAWVIVFATWWSSSLSENVASFDARIVMHVSILISCVFFVLIIKKEHYLKFARISAVSILVFIVAFSILPNSITLASLVGISLGCFGVSILMPFVFALSNTEKLYALVGSNLLICVLGLLQSFDKIAFFSGNFNLILSIIILSMGFVVVLFLRKNAFCDNSNESVPPRIPKRIYLTLVFNFFFAILGKGVGTGILNITAENNGNAIFTYYYIGGLIGSLIYFSLYAFMSKPFVLLGNISFAFITLALLFNTFAIQMPILSVGFALLVGIGNTVGIINMYYIISIISKKYNSTSYLKWAVIIVGSLGGIFAIIIGNSVHHANILGLTFIVSLVTCVVLLAFMIISPLLSGEQFYNDWARDSEMQEIDNEQFYLFKKYHLSRRELEVCKLLLQGYTLRQISAILSISYSAVNTYCTCSYRKLNINSRTELMILFKDFIPNQPQNPL